jgi:hypothetical protein
MPTANPTPPEPSGELLPCPFCGSAAKLTVGQGFSEYVQCTGIDCYAKAPGKYPTAELSIAAWNRRTRSAEGANASAASTPPAQPVAHGYSVSDVKRASLVGRIDGVLGTPAMRPFPVGRATELLLEIRTALTTTPPAPAQAADAERWVGGLSAALDAGISHAEHNPCDCVRDAVHEAMDAYLAAHPPPTVPAVDAERAKEMLAWMTHGGMTPPWDDLLAFLRRAAGEQT